MRYLILSLLTPIVLWSQKVTPIAHFVFQPDYQLHGNAANVVGPRIESPTSNYGTLSIESNPIVLKNKKPNQRIVNFIDTSKLPEGPFSIELWLVNHVNQPIGASISARTNHKVDWLLGYYGNEILAGMYTPEGQFEMVTSKITRGWKKYWLQVVLTYDGATANIYYNGSEKGSFSVAKMTAKESATHLELAGFLENEPYMEIANLVKTLNIYDRALSPEQINHSLNALQTQVETGLLYPEIFHFTAGPYLHYATTNSINLSWETNEMVQKAFIHYGETIPFTQSDEVALYQDPQKEAGHFIQTHTLDNLNPGTPYFYEIELINQSGDTIKSGNLTFATAPPQSEPFTFGVIGDTEARPHVNFQIAKLLWDERPNFVINLGDLSDGGQQPHKFEWTHEYFTGITPLASRIPFFPVPGNGESDLYWYNRYHKLPNAESYYTFHYGNAQFFMLNSNQKEAFAPGGEQYEWLEKQLRTSEATWKFVCHHHSPYSSDENDYGNSWKGKSNLGDLSVRAIVPLYEKYNVDIVLFGHLHTYQRTLPILNNLINQENGVIYMQGGGAGGNLEDFTPNHTWFSAKTYRGHHYFTFSLLDNSLMMRMYDSEGHMKDFMELKK